MSKKPFEEQSLTVGGRINWEFILGTGVLNLFSAIVKVEGAQSEQEVREAVLALYNSVPTAWIKADEQFGKDLEDCLEEIEIDTRKEWCGRKVGKPQIKKEERINPWRLFHACVDVFQRRGKLSSPLYKEIMTGIRVRQKKMKGRKQNGRSRTS